MFEQIRELIKAGGIYTIGVGLNSLIGFISLPIYSKYFTVDEYAIINLVFLIGTLSSTLTYLGASSALVRFYYDYSEETRTMIINSSLFLVVAGGILQVLIGLIVSKYISFVVFDSDEYSYYIVLSLLNAAIITINTTYLLLVRYANRNILFVILNGMSLIISIGTMILFLNYSKSLFIPFICQLLGNVSMLAYLVIINRKYNIFVIFKPELNKLLRFGVPVAFSSIIFYLLNTVDQLILKEMGTLYEAGIYAFGSKLSMMIHALFIVPFSMIWSQLRMKYKDHPCFCEFMSNISSYFVCICVLLTIGVVYLGRELIALTSLNSDIYISALQLLPFLILAQVIYGCSGIFDYGLQIQRKTLFYVYIGIGALIVNILMNIIFINIFGAKVVPMVKFVSYLIYFYFISYISSKYFKIIIQPRIYTLVAVLFIAIIGYQLFFITDCYIIRLLIVALFIILVFVSFLNKKEKQLLRKEFFTQRK